MGYCNRDPGLAGYPLVYNIEKGLDLLHTLLMLSLLPLLEDDPLSLLLTPLASCGPSAAATEGLEAVTSTMGSMEVPGGRDDPAEA